MSFDFVDPSFPSIRLTDERNPQSRKFVSKKCVDEMKLEISVENTVVI